MFSSADLQLTSEMQVGPLPQDGDPSALWRAPKEHDGSDHAWLLAHMKLDGAWLPG